MSADRPAFISTVTRDEQLGLNPTKKERVAEPLKAKNKADDVTWRHKKWLAEFQVRKNDISDLMEEKTQEVADAKQRFSDRVAQQRAAIRMARDINPEDDELLEEAMQGYITQETADAAAERAAQAAEYAPVQETKQQRLSANALNQHNKKAKSKKPKWAMTEDENEDMEELEVDELLQFTDDLDFEQYIDDMEVKEALSFVKSRIDDLAAGAPREVGPDMEDVEGEGDEEYNQTEGAQGIPRARAKWQRQQEQMETGSTMSRMSVGSNVSEKSILEDGQLKGVHSAASVRAMMAKEKLGQIDEGLDLSCPQPIVATAPSYTSNVGKTDASNLPYLYRHPAV